MTKVTHYLVTDACAAEVRGRTGLDAHDTPLGALVENPKPIPYEWFAVIDRALYPNRCRCTGVLHRADCPAGGGMT